MTQYDPTTGMPIDQSEQEINALLGEQEPAPVPENANAKLRQAFERKSQAADQALAEAAAARRELAFLKAGVDTSTPTGELFTLKYDGDDTPEAVKAAWEAVNPPAAATGGEQGPTPEQLAEQRTREGLSTSAPAAVLEPYNAPAKEEAIASAQAAIKQGMARDEGMGGFVNQLANAALAGDKTVLADNRG